MALARRSTAAALLLMLLVTFAGGHVALAAADPATAARSALGWLRGRQQNDGSFPGFDAGASADAIFALVAAGDDPNSTRKNGHSAVAYLATQAASYAPKSTAAAGKLALAATVAGKDPRSFGGQNLLALINTSYDRQTRLYGKNPTDHAYALLALASVGQSISGDPAAGLSGLQLPDGGWSFDGAAATGSDTNTTALVLQALAATKSGGDIASKALGYLKAQQNADGGFPYAKTAAAPVDSDANSTAAVIQGVIAVGVDPLMLKQGANDPLTVLVAFQNPSGALRYQNATPDDNDLATAQAIPALLGKTQPLETVSLPATVTPTASTALPATGALPDLAWLLLPALLCVATGWALRVRRS